MYIYLSPIYVYESTYLSSGYHISYFVSTHHLITYHLVIVKSYTVWNGQGGTLLCEPEAFFEVIDLSIKHPCLVKGRSQHSWGLWARLVSCFTHCHISSQTASKHTFQLWGNLRSWHHWNLLSWQCQKNSLISKSNVKFYFEVLFHFNGWLNFFFWD